jgi:SAM-dependent methyltransferase
MTARQHVRPSPPVRRLGQPGAVELLADPDRPRAWTLLVDSTPQSYVDLDDPLRLDFEYMQRIGHLLDLAAPAGAALRVLHLGGGALSLARYVAATRPGSAQLAVDDDAELVGLVREWLPLRQRGRRGGPREVARESGRRGGSPEVVSPSGNRGGSPEVVSPSRRLAGGGRIRIRIADARSALARLPDAGYDVVIADLFAGPRTPAHVTSVEFAAEARRVLTPGGTFVANIGDGPPLAHARARVATARAVFRDACLIADAAVLRGRRFGNLVLAAADVDLPAADLVRRVAADPFPARVVHGAELDKFASGARPITDARAQLSPVPPPGVFAR